jgi:hypothetical protein
MKVLFQIALIMHQHVAIKKTDSKAVIKAYVEVILEDEILRKMNSV